MANDTYWNLRIEKSAINNFKKIKTKDDEYKNLLKFAITHHHVANLGFLQMNTQNAEKTRKLLYKHGATSILHGHLHHFLVSDYWPQVKIS